MTDQPKPVLPSRSGRGLRIALGVSLAINLLVIGAVAGSALSGRGGDRGPDRNERPGAEMSAIGLYGRALSKSDRRAVGRALRAESGGQLRGLRQELRDLATEAVAVLKAEPFAADAFADILARQQDLIKSRADDGRAALVAHVSAMSPAQRASYAAGLEQALERGPGRWRDR